MKLAHRLVQVPRQLRHGLRAHHFAGQRGHHPPHLPGADAPQKRRADQDGHFFRPALKRSQSAGQKALSPSAGNAESNRAEAVHQTPLVVAVAVIAPRARSPFIPPPAGKAVPLPFRLQLEKPLPRQSRLPVQIAPETLFHLSQEVLEVLADRCYFRHGCKSPFLGSAFACQAKANLHPLAFYTINVTSPPECPVLTSATGGSRLLERVSGFP